MDGKNKTLRRKQLLGVLSGLFGAMDEAMLERIEGHFEWISLHGGRVLFEQGDVGQSMYIVLRGRLRVLFCGADGNHRTLGEISRGESVGEMAILSSETRSATVRAIRDSELVKISRQAFERIVELYPQVLHAISEILVGRLRRASRPRPAGGAMVNIAIVPLSPDVAAEDFALRLSENLGESGSVLHLNHRDVDEGIGESGIANTPRDAPGHSRLLNWLDEQEMRHDIILYQTDSTDSPWTRRCLRQADRILLLGKGGDPPESIGQWDRILQGRDARKSLVLLHAADVELPTCTARWLDSVSVETHHHLREDRPADFSRLARFLSGRSVGLVLGGGGALGFAHIGVIRALRESGIPIDLVGGTSMGASIAAQVALGWDYPHMIEVTRRVFIQGRPMKEFTLPIISLLRGKKFDRVAQGVCGDTRIEDLWLPFYCVSCNLTKAEANIHRRGMLWKAVRTSSSLPGIVPPVPRGRDLLVDGGVLNNLPGDVMRDISSGPMIVVNVSGQKDFSAPDSKIPSPWKMLQNRILPWRAENRMPNVLNLLMRTVMVGSVRMASEVQSDADWSLRPPVDHYGMLQMEAIEEIAEIGYRYTLEQLSQCKGDEPFLASRGD